MSGKQTRRRWTKQEEAALLRQVEVCGAAGSIDMGKWEEVLRSSDDLQRWSAKDLRDKHKRLTTSATKAGNEKPEAPAMLSQETDVATKAPPSSACVSPGGLLGWLKSTPTKPEKFYAVQVGRKCRIFSSWAECEQQTTGFPGAKYKSFKTEAEALEYMNAGDNSKPPPPAPQQAPPLPAAAAASSEQAVVQRKKPKSKNGGCDGSSGDSGKNERGSSEELAALRQQLQSLQTEQAAARAAASTQAEQLQALQGQLAGVLEAGGGNKSSPASEASSRSSSPGVVEPPPTKKARAEEDDGAGVTAVSDLPRVSDAMSLTALKAECKTRGMKGYSSYAKDFLVGLLTEGSIAISQTKEFKRLERIRKLAKEEEAALKQAAAEKARAEAERARAEQEQRRAALEAQQAALKAQREAQLKAVHTHRQPEVHQCLLADTGELSRPGGLWPDRNHTARCDMCYSGRRCVFTCIKCDFDVCQSCFDFKLMSPEEQAEEREKKRKAAAEEQRTYEEARERKQAAEKAKKEKRLAAFAEEFCIDLLPHVVKPQGKNKDSPNGLGFTVWTSHGYTHSDRFHHWDGPPQKTFDSTFATKDEANARAFYLAFWDNHASPVATYSNGGTAYEMFEQGGLKQKNAKNGLVSFEMSFEESSEESRFGVMRDGAFRKAVRQQRKASRSGWYSDHEDEDQDQDEVVEVEIDDETDKEEDNHFLSGVPVSLKNMAEIDSMFSSWSTSCEEIWDWEECKSGALSQETKKMYGLMDRIASLEAHMDHDGEFGQMFTAITPRESEKLIAITRQWMDAALLGDEAARAHLYKLNEVKMWLSCQYL